MFIKAIYDNFVYLIYFCISLQNRLNKLFIIKELYFNSQTLAVHLLCIEEEINCFSRSKVPGQGHLDFINFRH